MIESAFSAIFGYCKENDFKGWDLFDGLNSKILKATPLYQIKLLRLAWIQFFKRSCLNFRWIAAVPKDYNPKGLALFAAGLTAQGQYNDALKLFQQLSTMTCSGYSGTSWGYNFDWESRAFFVPQGTPNLVSTVFVANAYLDYFEKKGDRSFLETGEKACDFILDHLILEENSETLCFRYIPGENAVVHNAYMLAAALLGRIYRHTKNEVLYNKSRKAMQRAINALKPDFSWPYGERHHHQFVDNFHTGFNLIALREWMTSTGDERWKTELRKAYLYWLDNFWLDDGCPKYYNDSLYPIDIHCSAQGIVTCLKLQDFDKRSLPLAEKIAQWAIDNMQDETGYFYYQKTRWCTNKIPYIRWSQAWMFYALSLLTTSQGSEKNANLV